MFLEAWRVRSWCGHAMDAPLICRDKKSRAPLLARDASDAAGCTGGTARACDKFLCDVSAAALPLRCQSSCVCRARCNCLPVTGLYLAHLSACPAQLNFARLAPADESSLFLVTRKCCIGKRSTLDAQQGPAAEARLPASALCDQQHSKCTSRCKATKNSAQRRRGASSRTSA